MKRGDWIGLIEASYDTKADDSAWSQRVLESAAPLFGEGLALVLLLARVSPSTLSIEHAEALGPPEMRDYALATNANIPPPVADILYRGGAALGSLSELLSPSGRKRISASPWPS